MKNFSTAPALLEALTNQGCRVWMTDDRLRLSDPHGAMTDNLRQAIREHKESLLTLLELYEERAAIMEYCGGLPREEAERQAFQRYRSETHGGQMPDLLHGILLSRFNLWLEAQGQRPTTLLALWIALGMADVSSAPPSLI